jgi:3,4-dehydroadipyl-CoA semialdehyde dehydrogenase
MRLESYVEGRWQAGSGEGRPLVNPVTGEKLAEADSTGLDMLAALRHARVKGGMALGDMSFAERGVLLRNVADVLTANREKYYDIARRNSGNTKTDASIDIDGGIGTLKYYARIGKGLANRRLIQEAGEDQLAAEPVFFSRHYWASRPGVAIQINAFNFPSWGMWEKIAVATIAGVPSIAKPATATALLSHEMMRDVTAAGIVPEGAFNLVCGSGEGLVEVAGATDSISFTGSADTGLKIRSNDRVLAGARVSIEADSVNATVVAPDAVAGSPLFDLAVRETVKALSIKAGQLCTNIRRVFLPRDLAAAFSESVIASVGKLQVGDPADESVRIGPLVSKSQQEVALAGIKRLSGETRILTGGGIPEGLADGLAETGAFVAPTLLICDTPKDAKAVHEIEVFGPCVTAMPYDSFDDAVELAARGGGSLAMSLFTNDGGIQAQAVTQLGPWHGRIMIIDDATGKNHTGHPTVMPQCVHGGPGRAGGSKELGGLRGLRLHMQRSAVQGSPRVHESLAAISADAAL